LPSVWLFPILAVLATPPVAEEGGIRIETSIRGQIYTWTVTNIDAPPIVSIEIEQSKSYNPLAPVDWTAEIFEGGAYRAWTKNPKRAIRRGRSDSFSVRVGSIRAVPGLVSATVGFDSRPFDNEGVGTAGDDPKAVHFASMWGTVKPAPWPGLTIATTLVVIALLHATLLSRRERRLAPVSARH